MQWKLDPRRGPPVGAGPKERCSLTGAGTIGETQSLPEMQPKAEGVRERSSLASPFLLPSRLLPIIPSSWTQKLSRRALEKCSFHGSTSCNVSQSRKDVGVLI